MSESNSNKQWKRVPFEIELAKKIQSGEIEGRIITYFEKHPVRIITDELRCGYNIVYAEFIGDMEVVGICNKNGLGLNDYKALAIELPKEVPNPLEGVLNKTKDSKFGGYFESGNTDCGQGFEDACVKETPKHEFKPFDKVLVRHPDKTELCVSNSIWIPGIFQYKSVNSNLYFVSGKVYKDCIPYEGNEHLVGTTDNPNED